MSNPSKLDSALSIIDAALDIYKLDGFVVGLSGGNDSITTALVAALHPKFLGCVHANTGTGPISQYVSNFVADLCAERGWPLVVKKPFTTYPMLVAKYGFPGPRQHMIYFQYLKGRPLKQAMIEVRKKHNVKKIGFASGKRRAESKVRSTTEPHGKDGDLGVVINPIYDWSADECKAFMASQAITENKVKHWLGISGECLCGAHAAASERKIAMQLSDAQRRYIEGLEAMVVQARAVQLLEVEVGARDESDLMPEWATTWAHGKRSSGQTRVISDDQLAFGFLCTGCISSENADGDIGENPDLELLASRVQPLPARRL